MTNVSLSRRERLRRVVVVCCSFARNVAYHRAGQAGQAKSLLSMHHPEVSFWRQVNANFFDIAVLDWCKLFGDPKEVPRKRVGKHHWRRVVSDPDAFERGLLGHLSMNGTGFAAVIGEMRRFRDEFVAHLDDGLVMYVPKLDAASEAVAYYHRHIAEHEAQPGELTGLPTPQDYEPGLRQCEEEAARVYAARPMEAAA
jgi:hypothetical protein